MNIGKLLKYSLYLLLMIMVLFLIVTIYMYFFSNQPSAGLAYSFIVPISIFLMSFLYSRSVHERGLIRGIEMWVVYFALVLLLKVLFSVSTEINILMNLIYLPIAILGGIIGVNLRSRSRSA